MSTRLPPRYLPTLTEVVQPGSLAGNAPASEVASMPAQAPVQAPSHAPAASPRSQAPPFTAVPDRHALAQQLIQLVRPQLEAELRHIAQELFEAQFSALLPSMHLHIEEAVREALEQALPPAPDDAGN